MLLLVMPKGLFLSLIFYFLMSETSEFGYKVQSFSQILVPPSTIGWHCCSLTARSKTLEKCPIPHCQLVHCHKYQTLLQSEGSVLLVELAYENATGFSFYNVLF